MTLNLVNHDLGNKISFNTIETNMFKSNLISFYFVRPLSDEEATLNALLPMVLKRGSNKYKNNLEVQRKLEEMYGADFGISVSKRGEKQVIKYTMEYVDKSFVKEEDYESQVIDMVKDIIFNPYLENGCFKKEYVDQEKENLRRRIEGKINNKRGYALDRCIETMCRDEKYSISGMGNLEKLKEIDEKNLYDHFIKIIETSPIEIIYVGRENKEIINYVKDLTLVERKDIVEIKREEIKSKSTNKNMVHEELDVNQGKLVLGYRSSIPFEDDLYKSLVLAVEILGGSPNSKLFKNVREKESLAYYAGASLIKYKSIILIDSGIEFDSYDRALEIIIKQVEDVKAGDFTEEDIEIAKKSILSIYKSIDDSLYMIPEFFFGKILTGDERTIDEMITDTNGVEKATIVEASKSLNLDTVYFMKNKAHTEEV